MNYIKSLKTINLKKLLPIAYCLLLIIFPATIMAQRDTSKKTTIDITSSYKPILRNAVKINFSASQAKKDSSRPVLQYNIPADKVITAYLPDSVKAVALPVDSNMYLGTRHFIKVGYGNFQTPYLSAGLSFGDGKKKLLNFYAAYISSKGKIQHQNYTQVDVKATGNYFLKRHEVYGSASFYLNDHNLYGYDHTVYKYSKVDIHQQFREIAVQSGLRNTEVGEYGISYNPSIGASYFTNKDKLSELSFLVTAPVEKSFADVFKFKVEGKADVTFYNTQNLMPNVHFTNYVIQVAPSLAYVTPFLTINGGIIPTWDNGNFVWLPNVYAEARIKNNAVMFQAGWVGRYTKNSFRNLSAINPYLATPSTQTNTKEIEFYGGIKTTIAKHFSLNTKVGIIQYTNLPFFINDTANDNKAFLISNESRVTDLRMHADISYINQDKLTATAGVTFNGYTLMKDNARAWNTVPFEFNASVRWWAVKQIMLKADFHGFGAGFYLERGNTAAIFKPGADLSAGVEFKISKRFSAWMDVNNILNNKYERWHGYEVYGLNLIGGLKVNF